ncbi:helix-turn-helix domain-containing protein [Arthrobacter sp. NPDC092385]|uniref:helix-turn-helix domain-containing protein n=1 Tax=Arthrobacter sp. NPDC092385 TaxID=3363943 RepID=UPI003804A38C
MVDASELIAEGLISSGMSRADLARALGVRPGEVTARLKGERNITVRNLAKTLEALGLRLELGATKKEPAKHRRNPRPTPWEIHFQGLSAQVVRPRPKVEHSHSAASKVNALLNGRQ